MTRSAPRKFSPSRRSYSLSGVASTVPRAVSLAFEISPSNGPAAIAASTVGWTVNPRSEPLGSG